jgi:glycosyltransferase involved in cell wall biosynthesis
VKLVIQIPCFNEQATLPETVRDLPREIPGVDIVEVVVVDDGSTDRTSEVARSLGVTRVVRHTKNRGLAAAFQTGLDAAIALQADIIVNTDADHQYPGSAIPSLVASILEGRADIVLGDRKIHGLRHLPLTHRLLQKWGSAVVRRISGTEVPDAPSGFRAFSREAAILLEVLTEYTYTLETIIQAGRKGLGIACIFF